MADRAPTATTRRMSGHLRLYGAALVATVVASQVSLPWRLSGIAFGLLTLYAGARVVGDQIRLRRAGRPAPGWFSTALGIGLAGFLLLVLVGEAALYPLVSDNERCTARALTHADAKACDDALNSAREELLRRLQPQSAS